MRAGSLELLDKEDSLLAKTASVRWRGDGAEHMTNVALPQKGFDLVIANPPYTNANSIERQGLEDYNKGVSRFKAFGTDAATSTEIKHRTEKLGEGGCRGGNAGLGSDFLWLGHDLVRNGGVIAFILPLTMASASAWLKAREVLFGDFSDIVIVTSPSTTRGNLSPDPAMREVAVIARKTPRQGQPQGHLYHPRSLL